MDPVVLALTAYGHNFFCVSPRDAKRMADLAVSLSRPEDDEADLIDLYNLVWRANRDAQRIEESERHLPVCQQVEELPEYLLLPVEEVRWSRYGDLFTTQPANEDQEYPGFPPPWAPPPSEPPPHVH